MLNQLWMSVGHVSRVALVFGCGMSAYVGWIIGAIIKEH